MPKFLSLFLYLVVVDNQLSEKIAVAIERKDVSRPLFSAVGLVEFFHLLGGDKPQRNILRSDFEFFQKRLDNALDRLAVERGASDIVYFDH